MKTRATSVYRFSLMIVSLLLLSGVFLPGRAYAQWPPFSFGLTPQHDGQRITYDLKFSSQVDWTMTDVTIKIPIPEGTRFVEASALPTTQVDFDGQEVTFFTSFLPRSLKDASFTVEAVDPAATVFTTQAWMSWKGEQPGNYLADEFVYDLSQRSLNWNAPRSSLELEARAVVSGQSITYTLYPRNSWKRMWDLHIGVPLPEGTSFVSADAPASFSAGFDGREVSFFTVELPEQAQDVPLTFTVAIQDPAKLPIVTEIWADWKTNTSGDRATERTVISDVAVHSTAAQWVAFDRVGDVPFANYDLASIALEEDKAGLKATFYTAEDIGPVGEPLEFLLYIDSDCRQDTGLDKYGRGSEYRIRYQHSKGEATLYFRDTEADKWRKAETPQLDSQVDGNALSIWIPLELVQEGGSQFCWVGQAKNGTADFTPSPPRDDLPDTKGASVAEYDAQGLFDLGTPDLMSGEDSAEDE